MKSWGDILRGYIQLDKSGKYLFEALDRSKKQLLSCGTKIKAEINGKMIDGRVEHSTKLGYYFLSSSSDLKIRLSEIDFIEL